MQGNTTLIALVVIIAIAAAAYFLLTGSSSQTDLMGGTGETVLEGSLPSATDSVDDFTAAMEAELSASAAAIKAFDADVDASVADVRAAADTSTLYDPDNL